MFVLFVTWIHVIAAMLWVGGMLFFSLVFIPSLKGGLEGALKADLISRVGKRFRVVGWISLAVILFTGLFRFYQEGRPLSLYGTAFKLKLFLVFVMFALTFVHDLFLGPKSASLSRSALGSGSFHKMVRFVARLNLLIVLMIVWAAISFVRGF